MNINYLSRISTLVITLSVLFGQTQAVVKAQIVDLSESTQRVVFDSALFSEGTGLPQWANGYLVSRQVETFQPDTPNVQLYDKSGKKALQSAIWFPGSQRVLIYSAVATPKGEIIASGKAEKADGEAVTFIALTDAAGNVKKVIQTMGFAPATVCQAPDGTVWSFGGTGYDGNSRRPNPGATLRNFDFQKGELSSYLPRSSFAAKLRPGPEVNAYTRCLTDEVVAYSPSAHQYIVLKYGSNSPHVYQVEAVPAELRLTGFAAIDSKRIYGHYSSGNNTGLYVLSFDEPSNTVKWNPIEGTIGKYTTTGVITALWGNDGDKLLIGRAEDRAREAAIHWTTPVE
jgi:hypothetical protein